MKRVGGSSLFSWPCWILNCGCPWTALKRFCWRTDGAVGKKSAKPAEERDMMKDGYTPNGKLPRSLGSILNQPLTT